MTGGQEIKLAILVKFGPFQLLFCLFSLYFFASIFFGDGFFQFQDKMKVSLSQAPLILFGIYARHYDMQTTCKKKKLTHLVESLIIKSCYNLFA